MMTEVFLAHPEALNIQCPGAGVSHGANQEWYSRFWRRMAGCGPTAAAMQMAYLSRVRPSAAALCPLEQLECKSFAVYMDKIWTYVTPGRQGLNRVDRYVSGIRAYLAEKKAPFVPEFLEIPAPGGARPGFDVCVDFLRRGLTADCPVAFLNLDNGAVDALDKWHWVLLVGLRAEGERAEVTVSDAGKLFPIDLRLWYDTARDRGGFVWLREVSP